MEILHNILVVCLLLNSYMCSPQILGGVLPPSIRATESNGVKVNIPNSSNGGPQGRPAPIQIMRNATDGIISSSSSGNSTSSNTIISSNSNSNSSRSSSSIYINTAPHPLQLLIDALMQPQNSNQLMGGLLPRIPLNTPGENSFLHRIGVHVLGRAQLHMNQTEETPLPFVLAALTTPPSVASLANADIKLSKGIQSVTPFTSSPLELSVPSSPLVVASTPSEDSFITTRELETPAVETFSVPNSSLVKASTASNNSFISTRELETPVDATFESVKIPNLLSTRELETFAVSTSKPASIPTERARRPKPPPPSTKKHQGKKSIGKSSKRRNPTANDAVERRMAMIARMERKVSISTTTARSISSTKTSSIPSTTASRIPPTAPSSTPTSPTTVQIINIPSERILNVDSSPKITSNLIVSKANIIDAIVATSGQQTASLKSPINADAIINPKSTTHTSTTFEFTTSSLNISSTTPLSTITPSISPVIANVSASSPVAITVNGSPSGMSVRSGVKLDLTQLFRQIAQAAAKETAAAAAAARGKNIGNIISIRSVI